MKRKSAFAAGFNGRWRIAEMDMLARQDLDLPEPAHISFSDTADGDMAFGALSVALDAAAVGQPWDCRTPREPHLSRVSSPSARDSKSLC